MYCYIVYYYPGSFTLRKLALSLNNQTPGTQFFRQKYCMFSQEIYPISKYFKQTASAVSVTYCISAL